MNAGPNYASMAKARDEPSSSAAKVYRRLEEQTCFPTRSWRRPSRAAKPSTSRNWSAVRGLLCSESSIRLEQPINMPFGTACSLQQGDASSSRLQPMAISASKIHDCHGKPNSAHDSEICHA